MTDYYYQQSQENFIFYGQAYPQVLVTANPEDTYVNVSPINPDIRELDLGAITQELLNVINLDPNFDLGEFDANDDGYLDHVFFIPRRLDNSCIACAGARDPNGNLIGAAGISLLGYSSPNPEYGNDPGNLKSVDSGGSGSYNRWSSAGNIIPLLDLLRLMAHEFGHDMWENSALGGAHINAINDPTGVPESDPNHLGYALMVGRTFPATVDTRGDLTISAFERHILNTPVGEEWIDCPVLTTGGPVTVTDLYSDNSNNCHRVSVPNGALTRDIYLSNRQRIGPFDVIQTVTCFNPVNDHGLMTTGLLAQANQNARMGVMAADGDLALNVAQGPYAGDLFEPGTTIQITPWTRPNVNGFTTYPAGFNMQPGNWQAIDNIQFSGGPSSEMAFDYIEDFRQTPTIREDSWMGAETLDVTFAGNVIVINTSVLNISTRLGFSSQVIVNAGSEVVLDTGADVTVNAGGQIAVFGEMNVFDTLTNNGSITIDGTMNYETTDAIATGATFEIENGADVTFQSGTSITLEPGFHVRPGSHFRAFIDMPAPRARIALAPVSPTKIAQASEQQVEAETNLRQRMAEAEVQEPLRKAAEAVPTAFSLSPNYPNPFNPTTIIPYALKDDVHVTLTVYNVLGQQVATLVEGFQEAGYRSATWDGRDMTGRPVPSGTYLFRLVAGDFVQARTMLLLR